MGKVWGGGGRGVDCQTTRTLKIWGKSEIDDTCIQVPGGISERIRDSSGRIRGIEGRRGKKTGGASLRSQQRKGNEVLHIVPSGGGQRKTNFGENTDQVEHDQRGRLRWSNSRGKGRSPRIKTRIPVWRRKKGALPTKSRRQTFRKEL